MRKSEAVKQLTSCHEVQGDMEHKNFEFVPDTVGDKISSSSTDEIPQVYRTFFRLQTLVKVILGSLQACWAQNSFLYTPYVACLFHVVHSSLILLEEMEITGNISLLTAKSPNFQHKFNSFKL